MHQLKIPEIIEVLGLLKHPEGGYYRELYRSDERILQKDLPKRYSGDRAFCTSIYFMLTEADISAFHKIRSDETWHFYSGRSVTIYQIDSSGDLKRHLLGLDILNGEKPQITIEKETYFGAKVNGPGYCLMGCTVAPGFDFADFEIPGKDYLLKKYSQHREIIERLT